MPGGTRRRARRLGVLATAALVAALAASAPAAALPPRVATPPSPATMPASLAARRAVETYLALQKQLYVPSTHLYLGTGLGYGYLWPFANAMAATAMLAGIPSVQPRFGTALAQRFAGLRAYLDLDETDPSGVAQPPAFESAVGPPDGLGGATYYDDNAWTTLDLIADFDQTGDTVALARAQRTFRFIVSGWSTATTGVCPGGVFWEDVAGSSRNTVSNAPSAEAGVELYQITGDRFDLRWAERMYAWVHRCLEMPSHLYGDHVNADGTVDDTVWSYNQGTMIGAGVLLHQVTGERRYLTEATDTARAALAYFGTGSTLLAQGPAFDAIYFRNLAMLDCVRPDKRIAEEASAYGRTAWEHDRDRSTGLFTFAAGVNGTAPMIEIYALLAGSPGLLGRTGCAL